MMDELYFITFVSFPLELIYLKRKLSLKFFQSKEWQKRKKKKKKTHVKHKLVFNLLFIYHLVGVQLTWLFVTSYLELLKCSKRHLTSVDNTSTNKIIKEIPDYISQILFNAVYKNQEVWYGSQWYNYLQETKRSKMLQVDVRPSIRRKITP